MKKYKDVTSCFHHWEVLSYDIMPSTGEKRLIETKTIECSEDAIRYANTKAAEGFNVKIKEIRYLEDWWDD